MFSFSEDCYIRFCPEKQTARCKGILPKCRLLYVRWQPKLCAIQQSRLAAKPYASYVNSAGLYTLFIQQTKAPAFYFFYGFNWPLEPLEIQPAPPRMAQHVILDLKKHIRNHWLQQNINPIRNRVKELISAWLMFVNCFTLFCRFTPEILNLLMQHKP